MSAVDPMTLGMVEVYDAGILDGFALTDRGSRTPVTPVRCCATCAWADARHVVHVAGVGLRYQPGVRRA